MYGEEEWTKENVGALTQDPEWVVCWSGWGRRLEQGWGISRCKA